MTSQGRLDGTLFVAGTQALYVGALVATARHAHHAAQIIVAPGGVSIEDGVGGRIRTRAAIVPPRVPHGHGACAHAALLFLDGNGGPATVRESSVVMNGLISRDESCRVSRATANCAPTTAQRRDDLPGRM